MPAAATRPSSRATGRLAPAHGSRDSQLSAIDGGHDSVSRLLVAFARSWREERIDLGSLIAALERRGHGVLLVLFGLPNLIPNPTPGLSAVFGIPLAILSVQMIGSSLIPGCRDGSRGARSSVTLIAASSAGRRPGSSGSSTSCARGCPSC